MLILPSPLVWCVNVYRELIYVSMLVMLATTGAETVAQKEEINAAGSLFLFSLLAGASSSVSPFIERVCLSRSRYRKCYLQLCVVT